MTARNDITGDSISTRKTNDAYRDGWDRIFKQKRDEAANTEKTANDEDTNQDRNFEQR